MNIFPTEVVDQVCSFPSNRASALELLSCVVSLESDCSGETHCMEQSPS